MAQVLFSTILTAVFVVVLAVTWKVLPELGLRGLFRAVLATCVALLSVLGVSRHFPSSAAQLTVGGDPMIDAVLIPYAALGLTLLLFFMVLLWLKFREALSIGKSRLRHWKRALNQRHIRRKYDAARPRRGLKEEDDNMAWRWPFASLQEQDERQRHRRRNN